MKAGRFQKGIFEKIIPFIANTAFKMFFQILACYEFPIS